MSLRTRILWLFALFAVVPIVTVGVADHVRSATLLREVVQLAEGASAEELVAAYGQSRSSYLLFILTVVGATSLAFSLLINRVMRRLARLTAAAEAIGKGDFTPWLPPPGGDEVGTLSFAIGSMVERVGEMLRQVEQSRQMAALGEFSAYLAHEIRNPLSSLKLNLQGAAREVRSGRAGESLPEVVESCVQEINRLDRVVHTILRLGRSEPGARTPCAVHAVVDDAIHLLAMQLQRRNIRVEVRRQAFSDQVLASGEQLKGVLLNLFLNAADAMPEGGRLRVWTDNVPGRDGRPAIRIHVADDGAGVPPVLRERIFDPFFTTKREGSGIGLSLALRTIRHHGGDIGYAKSSEMEPGAEFVITLPLLETMGTVPQFAPWPETPTPFAVAARDPKVEDFAR